MTPPSLLETLQRLKEWQEREWAARTAADRFANSAYLGAVAEQNPKTQADFYAANAALIEVRDALRSLDLAALTLQAEQHAQTLRELADNIEAYDLPMSAAQLRVVADWLAPEAE